MKFYFDRKEEKKSVCFGIIGFVISFYFLIDMWWYPVLNIFILASVYVFTVIIKNGLYIIAKKYLAIEVDEKNIYVYIPNINIVRIPWENVVSILYQPYVDGDGKRFGIAIELNHSIGRERMSKFNFYNYYVYKKSLNNFMHTIVIELNECIEKKVYETLMYYYYLYCKENTNINDKNEVSFINKSKYISKEENKENEEKKVKMKEKEFRMFLIGRIIFAFIGIVGSVFMWNNMVTNGIDEVSIDNGKMLTFCLAYVGLVNLVGAFMTRKHNCEKVNKIVVITMVIGAVIIAGIFTIIL